MWDSRLAGSSRRVERVPLSLCPSGEKLELLHLNVLAESSSTDTVHISPVSPSICFFSVALTPCLSDVSAESIVHGQQRMCVKVHREADGLHYPPSELLGKSRVFTSYMESFPRPLNVSPSQ